jgi:hypothetical protein
MASMGDVLVTFVTVTNFQMACLLVNMPGNDLVSQHGEIAAVDSMPSSIPQINQGVST